MAPIKDLKNSMTEETSQDTEKMVQVPESELAKIMARLQKLEWWSQSEEIKKSKEHYQWPLTARLKTWGDKIVVSYEWYRKEPAYDLYYKNTKWEWIDNHFLKLTFSDGKTEWVQAQAFWVNHGYTWQLEFDAVLLDGSRIKQINQKRLASLVNEVDYLVFQYGKETIEIKPQFIN